MKCYWVLLGLMVAACGQADANQPQKLPTAGVELQNAKGVKALTVEVANDDAERATGMMFRKSMAADSGMLFVWPGAEERSFWMHNTYVPLDLMFVRGGKVIRVIPWAKPLDETSLPSGGPADMVLEVPGGWALKNGYGVGDTLQLR